MARATAEREETLRDAESFKENAASLIAVTAAPACDVQFAPWPRLTAAACTNATGIRGRDQAGRGHGVRAAVQDRNGGAGEHHARCDAKHTKRTLTARHTRAAARGHRGCHARCASYRGGAGWCKRQCGRCRPRHSFALSLAQLESLCELAKRHVPEGKSCCVSPLRGDRLDGLSEVVRDQVSAEHALARETKPLHVVLIFRTCDSSAS